MGYTTISWLADDDVTSEKLQQMADNDEWLKNDMPRVSWTDLQGTSLLNGTYSYNGFILLKGGWNHGNTDAQGDITIPFGNPFPNGVITVQTQLYAHPDDVGSAFLKRVVTPRGVTNAGFLARVHTPETGFSEVNNGPWSVTWFAMGL